MDIALYETHNGGDISLLNNDINITESLWVQVYLGLFGGNVEQSTVDGIEENEQRFDWFGNAFLQLDPNEQLNSETERVLNATALNTSGRLAIQRAVENDLQFLQQLGNVTVNVTIPTVDTVQIDVTIDEPEQIDERRFRIIWDATRNEIVFTGEVTPDGDTITGRSWIMADGFWNDDGQWVDNDRWNDQ